MKRTITQAHGAGRYSYFLTLLMLSILLASCQQEEIDSALDKRFASMEKRSIRFQTQSGDDIDFTAYVADDDSSRAQGLMFVREFPDSHAMLFDFKRSRSISMWMKNTLISLDMIFISANGTVTGIAKYTTPGSTDPIPGPGRNRAVIEINAGLSDQWGIAEGDKVLGLPFGEALPESP